MPESRKPLPRLSRLLPGVYYGWVITAATGAIAFATVGVGFYSMAVWLDGLPEARGFARADVAAPTSLYFVLQGLLGPAIGRLVDRHGSLRPLASGAAILAVCLLLLGQVRAVWQLWPIYTLMAVGFALCSTLATSALINRWFIALRARALTYAHAGVSLGGMTLTPLATWALHAHGLPWATALLAAIAVGITLPVAFLALSQDPRDHGLAPDGGAALRYDSELLSERYQTTPWRAREIVATPVFWVLALAFSLIMFGQQGVLIHQVTLVHERVGAAQAGAYGLSITAVASVTGRFIIGSFADRASKRHLAMAMMGIQAIGLWLFSGAGSLGLLYLSAVVFGFTIGNVFMLQSLLVGEFFGIASFGTAFGLLIFITQIAGGLGAWGIAQLNAVLGGYESALRLLAAVAATSAVVVMLARPPRREADSAASEG